MAKVTPSLTSELSGVALLRYDKAQIRNRSSHFRLGNGSYHGTRIVAKMPPSVLGETQLTPSILDDLSRAGVAIPSYNRADVKSGIMHFGFGNFHRAHEAMYIDKMMNEGKGLDWGICGVGVLAGQPRMRDVMAAQSCLYTLLLKHADKTLEPRVIGCISDFLYTPDDPEAVIAKLSSPEIRVVSLTITEGGYNFNEVTGEFDFSNPGVVHDLNVKEPPVTVFGLMTEALARRRKSGVGPFSVVSCDNVRGNGDVARQSVLAFAGAKDQALAQWIGDEVMFPNSMVDRITPVTSEEDRKLLKEKFGIGDEWPVTAETFTQWVLEDHFCSGRPPFEDVGVQLVDDVEPYELMKLRLLNAGHQAMCYFGYLCGLGYANEAATDPQVRELVRRYMCEEGSPTLRPVPGIDLAEYEATLIERFSNPEVRDTLARLCAESSDRITAFVLPVIRDNLASGGRVELSAAIVASWARYAEGVDEAGNPITIKDKLAETLTATALTQGENPLAFIQNKQLFGDLANQPRFVEPYLKALKLLKTEGARATLTAILQ